MPRSSTGHVAPGPPCATASGSWTFVCATRASSSHWPTATTVATPYVIAADGMWSPTRKLLGVGPADYRGDWHAFRQYFRNVSPRAARELRVWFEPDFLPGYAWSFPVGDGRANVGFGIQRGASYTVGDMKNLWPDVLARPTVRDFLGEHAEPEAPHKAWPIPACVDHMVTTHRPRSVRGRRGGGQ